MKFLFFTILLTLTLYAVENPFIKKLPFKEAIIEYSLSGSQKGIKTLYIKEYGIKRVAYIKKQKNIMLKNNENEKYILTTKKWVYNINPKTNIAIRTPNLQYLLYIRYKELSQKEREKVRENLKKIRYLPISDSNFKIIKNYTKIEGIPCDLLIQHGKKICYAYNGALVLKSTIEFLGYKNYEILYSIYKTKVDPLLFDVSSYKIIDNKIKSVQKYEQSKKIIDFLKRDINTKIIFLKNKNHKEDYNQIIQEGIKELIDF